MSNLSRKIKRSKEQSTKKEIYKYDSNGNPVYLSKKKIKKLEGELNK